MRPIVQAFGHKITSDRFDSGLGQLACWFSSVLMLALGFFKLASLPLTESELFFGLLLVLAVALLGVILGMLLRIERKLQASQIERNRLL